MDDVDRIADVINRHMKPSDVADAWLFAVRQAVESGMITQEIGDKITVMAAALFMVVARESDPGACREACLDMEALQINTPDRYKEALDDALQYLKDEGLIVKDEKPDKDLH